MHNLICQEAITDSLLIEYDNDGKVEDNENDYGEFDIMLFDNEFSNKDIVQSDQRQQKLEVRGIIVDALFGVHTLNNGVFALHLKNIYIHLNIIYFFW